VYRFTIRFQKIIVFMISEQSLGLIIGVDITSHNELDFLKNY